MNQLGVYRSHFGLESLDIQASAAYWNIGAARLVERAIQSGEGLLTTGAPWLFERVNSPDVLPRIST